MSNTDDELMSLGADNIDNDDDLDIDDDETISAHPSNVPVEKVNENSSLPPIAPTKRKAQQPKSAVWTHFKRIKITQEDGGEAADDDNSRCKCNYCGKEYNCNTGLNGTSSLWKHLKICKKKIPKISGQTELTFGSTVGGETSICGWKYDHAAIKKEMALLIMEGELPFKLVDHPRFRSLLKLLQPRFNPISRQMCRKDVLNLYESEKSKLKGYLRSSSQAICLTTDTWTSNRGTSFMSITAHYVDDQWNLNKKIINFVPITNHRGYGMGIIIERCLKEWGIRKLLTCTVDNASANDHVVRYLKSKFSSILRGEYMQVRCVAHSINLVVCEGLKEFNVSIARIREAIKYVRGSSTRMHKFHECVEMEGITSKNLLCLDVCTRWNSTFFMLDVAEKFELAFSRYADIEPQMKDDLGEGNGVGVPTSSDWVAVRRFLTFLSQFYELTNKVSGTSYVTSCTFFHELFLLYDVLLDAKNGNDTELSAMGDKMLQKCYKYWSAYSDKMNKLLFATVIIDPRYKFKYVELAIKGMYRGEPGEVLAEVVKGLLYRLFDEYKNTFSSTSSVIQSYSVSSSVDSYALSAREKGMAKLKGIHLEVGAGTNLSELEKYLGEAIEQGDENFDILAWWRGNCNRFPILSMLARDLLAIPVSTVASESAFSMGGRVLNSFRSSLTPKIVEALICGSDWIRSSSSATMNIEEDLEEQEKFENEISSLNKS